MNIARKTKFAAVKNVIRHGKILSSPKLQQRGTFNPCHYILGSILQLDPDTCLLMAGMEEQGGADLCVGAHGFVFKKLEDIREENAIVLSEPIPNYTYRDGRPCYLISGPMFGSFVPLGSQLSNGQPHPAAGHGFVYSLHAPYQPDRCGPLPGSSPFIRVFDIAWDGESLQLGPEIDLYSDVENAGSGITPPIPYEDGFLQPIRDGGNIRTCQIGYVGGKWTIIKKGQLFATEFPGACEPSLQYSNGKYYAAIRADLLYGVEVGCQAVVAFFVSEDGFTFRHLYSAWNHTVPRVLNKGLDGSLYLVTNDGPAWLRNPLVAKPFTETGLGESFDLHDENGIRDDSGPSIPFADHAVACNVRLEGRNRHFLVYRVCDLLERTAYSTQTDLAKKITAQGGPIPLRDTTGTYLLELEY